MATAGQRLLATDAPAYGTDTELTSGTTTSGTYTATLTGGTACGVSFVAPTSGAVLILNTARINNSGVSTAYMSVRIGTGSSIGAGTVVQAASDDIAASVVNTNAIVSTHSYIHTGLTPGDTYNVQQQFRVASGTGTFASKRLHVTPLL